MKRFWILCMLSLLVMLPAFASDVALSGWARYGAIVDSTDDTVAQAVYARLYATFTVDEYTKMYLRFFNSTTSFLTSAELADGDLTTASSSIDNVYLYYGYIQSDIAGYAGLSDSGIGINLIAGKTWVGDSSYDSITSYGLSTGTAGVGTAWLLGSTISMAGIGNLELAINPTGSNDFYIGLNTTQSGDWGSVSAEVCFDGNSAAQIADGYITSTACYDVAISDLSTKIGVGVKYDLGSSSLTYHTGAKATYGSIGNVAVKLVGADSGVETLAASADITAISPVTIRGAAKFDISSDATDTFQGADVAAKFDVGAADIYLGYLITSVGAGNVFAPTSATNGGAYIKVDLSY